MYNNSKFEMVKIQTLFNTVDINIVRLLLFHGADVDEQNKFGETPLHVHASSPPSPSKYAILKILMERGANPDARNIVGRTPMHVAVWHGDAEAVAMLAESSDLWRTMDDEGVTPMDLARDRDEPEVVRVISRIARERAMIAALSIYRRCGDYDCARMIANIAFPDIKN